MSGAGRDEFEQTAEETPVDNETIDCSDGENVQEVLEDLCDTIATSASPGFTWGKGGSAGPGEYLYNEDVESNKAGRLVPFDGQVTEFFVNNEATSGTRTLQLRRRRPCQTGSWTTVAEIDLDPGDPCGSFTNADFGQVDLLKGDELSVRVKNNSNDFENPIVGIIIKGAGASASPGGGDQDINKATQGIDTAGSQSVGESGTDIVYGTTLESSDIATINGGTGVITIQKDGFFKLHYDITIDSSSRTRSASESKLQEDTGGGFTDIPGTFRVGYHRNKSQGGNSYGATIYRQMSSGDEIKLVSEEEPNGGGVLSTIANGTVLSVQYLRDSN